MAYDYKNLEDAVLEVKMHPYSRDSLTRLQNELNKCYPDSRCSRVIYTINTDKLFFGMCVLPIISENELNDIITTNKPVRLNNYCLEIDSKLFDPGAGLTSRELTAIVLHEVGHIVNDAEPVDKARKAMDIQYTTSNSSMKNYDTYDDINYVLTVGITDTIRKLTSIFYTSEEEILADRYVVKCGYGPELASALKKIDKNGWSLNRTVNNKFVVLAWCMRLHHDFGIRRIAAIKAAKRASELTGSELEKNMFITLGNRIRAARGGMVRESTLLEHDKSNNIFYKAKRNSIKKYEEDYFEYVMMARNVTDQDEALWMMREINARISIIENFLSSEQIPEKEFNRWSDLLDNYLALRDRLSKTVTYKDRFIGVQVNYPAIKGMDY